jgi:hypothetical protein
LRLVLDDLGLAQFAVGHDLDLDLLAAADGLDADVLAVVDDLDFHILTVIDDLGPSGWVPRGAIMAALTSCDKSESLLVDAFEHATSAGAAYARRAYLHPSSRWLDDP